VSARIIERERELLCLQWKGEGEGISKNKKKRGEKNSIKELLCLE